MREWTDSSGRKIRAAFVAQKQGYVQLKSARGKLFSVPINKFSHADQDYLKGL